MGGPCVRYMHPKLNVVQQGSKGYGYVASGLLRRGELLLEEGKRKVFMHR